MALIEEYHVIPDMYEVDPSTNPNIVEGQVVTLDSDAFAIKAQSGSSFVVGVAGDSTSESGDDEKNTEYQDSLVVNSQGSTRKTQNRVTDAFNETQASAKITVYTAHGKFSTDQYETEDSGSPITYSIGDDLYPSDNGRLTNVNGTTVVGKVVATPREYPSGVPGTEAPDGNLSIGTFLTFLLRV